jgi:[CysO sulfur-carrier protein]-S-L-cysteine hydrolase
MQSVMINREIFEGIIRHAREEAPLECCGLLMGASEAITHQRKMVNMLQSQNRYSMDPKALFEFFRDLRSVQMRHLGIYHSHPVSEAYPSKTDVDESYYPDCTYLIVSLKEVQSPSIRAFDLAHGSIQEKELQIID